MTIAPWLRGADVLGAIQAGSNAGLQLRAAALREAAQQAEERRAADALQLDYARVEAENQRAALSQQAQTERARASDALQALRDRELGRHHLATEQKSAADLLRLAAEDKAQQEHNAATLAETKDYHAKQLTKPTALQSDMDFASKLKQQAMELRDAGDIEGATKAEYLLSLTEGKLLGPRQTIETTTPEGVVTRVTTGGKATDSDLTTSTKTKLQEKRIERENPISVIAHIERNMAPGDVGLRGEIGEFKDRIAAQVFPEVADRRRISVQNSLDQLRVDLYKTMRSDSNIGVREVEDIKNMLPAHRIKESYPRALQTLADMKRRMIEAERRESATLGVPPHDWALTAKEIKQQQVAGKITEAQAVNLLLRYFPKMVEDVK